jgi:hypothetical protein
MDGTTDGSYTKPSLTCRVCGHPSVLNAFLCPDCRSVYRPRLKGDKAARFRHMRDHWDPELGYTCAYTGLKLDLVDRTSPLYAEWEHATPGDESSVVLAAALVNRMKCYLAAEEFKHMVRALARYFDDPDPARQFDLSAFPTGPVPQAYRSEQRSDVPTDPSTLEGT